jgi:hypothetical protein
MGPRALYRLGLCEAAQAIRRGALTCEELTRALLERIAQREGTVRAFQWIDLARALELGRRADRRRRSGEAVGPLHGVPVGVKDIIDTRGIPTTLGSAIFDGRVPERSAAVVERLEAAGAFVLGKTVPSDQRQSRPGGGVRPERVRCRPARGGRMVRGAGRVGPEDRGLTGSVTTQSSEGSGFGVQEKGSCQGLVAAGSLRSCRRRPRINGPNPRAFPEP